MHVEPMTGPDIEAVTNLAVQLGYPVAAAIVAERFAQITAEVAHGLFVARADDGRVIGWVHVHRDPASLLTEERAVIGALIVEDGQRGQGIGKLLLERAEDWARQQGIGRIRVGSNVLRTGARRFYEREGYRVEKSWNVFVKDLA